MSLHAVAREGDGTRPWLVFLHGFSGDGGEWQATGERLADWPRLYVDLPGHGASSAIPGGDFAAVSAHLQDTLNSYNILSYWLIGYSLGGRVAMYFACQQPRAGLKGLIVEGGHPGLQSESERRRRREGDLHWAGRFACDALAGVFSDWYRQPVFASLNDGQRAALAAQKAHNNGVALAEMLMATSLSAQPDLRPALAGRGYPFHYLCGERDEKFRALARALDAPCTLIPLAGHNAHRDNPDAVAACLAGILQH